MSELNHPENSNGTNPLRNLLIEYKKQNPRKSWRYLADKIGSVSHTTLERHYTGKIKSPNFRVFRDVVLSIFDISKAHELIAQNFPDKKDLIDKDKTIFNSAMREEGNKERILSLYKNFFDWRVYTLAMTIGITKEKIIRVLGSQYANSISKLLELRLVVEDGAGRLIPNQQTFAYFNPMTSLYETKNVCRLIEESILGDKVNLDDFSWVITQGINGQTKSKLRKMTTQFLQDVTALVTKPENQGELPCYFLTALTEGIDHDKYQSTGIH